MAQGPERLHAGWEMSWRCPPGCGVQAPWQPGPAPQNLPQHLGILGPADNLGFGVMGFSWDFYFSFPTSLGKRLICGGDIFGRTRDGGNRYKAKLLGSYKQKHEQHGKVLL